MYVYVARQPIFNRNKAVFAYELLYRSGFDNRYPDLDADQATASTIVNSFISMGFDTITRGKKAFINFTKQHLDEETAFLIPSSSLGIEIIEDVEPDECTIDACINLKKHGYLLLLDDFSLKAKTLPLLKYVDIVKIDIGMEENELNDLLNYLKRYRTKILAEKVETLQEYERARKKGFHYFQGYFFCRPVVMEGKDISDSKLHNLQLLQELYRPEVDFDRLEALISQDLSLSYKLMRFINSAAFPLRDRIRSIRQAIVLLGQTEMIKWASLIMLRSLSYDKPDELLITAVARARFCESIAQLTYLRNQSADLFLMGLFSLLDAFLDRPMASILNELPLSDEIKGALLGEENDFKKIYELVTLYEKGRWLEAGIIAGSLGITEEDLLNCYIKSMELSGSVFR